MGETIQGNNARHLEKIATDVEKRAISEKYTKQQTGKLKEVTKNVGS